MFDDQPINNNQIPGNLPIGEPEDMFASTEENVQNDAPTTQPDQPSISQNNSALGAGVLKPKMKEEVESNLGIASEAPESAPIENIPPVQINEIEPKVITEPELTTQSQSNIPPTPQPANEMYSIKEPSIGKGIVIVVVVAIAILVFGVGGWWVYNNYMTNEDLPVEESADLIVPPEFTFIEEENLIEVDIKADEEIFPEEELSEEIIDEQILFGEPIDKDADGLDDTREADIGTNPNNWDSDGDGLSDGDEVIIWKTDPLNPDTDGDGLDDKKELDYLTDQFNPDSDGDGYSDGEEVENGYNPAGPKRLSEIIPTEE